MVYESKGYMELIQLTGGFNFLCNDDRGSITTAQAGKNAI